MSKPARILTILAVAAAVGGCASTRIPIAIANPLCQDPATANWLIIGPRGDVVDLAQGTMATLKPFLHRVLGDAIDWKTAAFLPSRRGSYIASTTLTTRIWLVNVRDEIYRQVDSPLENCSIMGMAWSPDERRLLCYACRTVTGNIRQGRLFLLSIKDMKWQAIDAAGEVRGPNSGICADAWEDDQAFLYGSGGEIWRCDLDIGRCAKVLGSGAVPRSIGPRGFIYRRIVEGPESTWLKNRVYTMALTSANGEVTEQVPLYREGRESEGPEPVYLELTPARSPDYRYFIFINRGLNNIPGYESWGPMAVRDMWLYDTQTRSFSLLLAHNYPGGPIVGRIFDAITSASWVDASPELLAQLRPYPT